MAINSSSSSDMFLCLTLANISTAHDDDFPCTLDIIHVTSCSFFVYVVLLAFVCLKCRMVRQTTTNRFFLHNVVSLTLLANFLLSLCPLSELVLIHTRQRFAPLFPLSIADSALHLIAALSLPCYFLLMESRPGLLLLAPLLTQTLSSAAVFGWRVTQMHHLHFNSQHLAFWTSWGFAVINAMLFVLFVIGGAKKCFQERKLNYQRRRQNNNQVPEEKEESDVSTSNDEMVYLHNEASLFSKMTFSWLLPLLRKGYKLPLEIGDLHSLPSSEKARKHFERLKAIIIDEEEKKERFGILRSCLKMNWPLVALGGVFRLLADIFGFAGALSIKFIVDSISADFDQMLQNENTNITDLQSNGKNNTMNIVSYQSLTYSEFFSDSYIIAILLFLATLGQGVFSQASTHLLTLAGMRSKNGLHVLLYEKALRLPVGTVHHGSVLSDTLCLSSNEEAEEANNEGNIDIGFIMNLASEDILNIREFIWNIHYLWALPLKIMVIIVLLYLKLGLSGAIGVVIGTFIIVPLQFFVGKLMSDNNKRIFAAQDVRLYKSTETMQGMKTVKLGCLEDAMLNKIDSARQKELKFLRRDSFFWSIMAFLASVSTIVVTILTVGLYVAIEDEPFSSAEIFSALALLGQLTVCLSVFPVTIPIFIKGMVSRERLLDFFSRKEISHYKQDDPNKRQSIAPKAEDFEDAEEENEHGEDEPFVNGTIIEEEGELASLSSQGASNSIHKVEIDRRPSLPVERHRSICFPEIGFAIEEGTFAWPKTNINALRDINLAVKTGSLTIAIGPSGSGKSALISALLEEMERLRGKVKWHLPPAVAFTGQKPFLLNASVKDNILLGRPFKEKRYKKVIAACDLIADIDLLPEGDETEVGERGVLLSGGQRQRLAIARCLYSKAACTLLDAPFSSLDSDITQHIFYQGILGILLKRKRTVFMATDRVDFLDRADNVVYLKDGTIAAQGHIEDIIAKHPELKVNIQDMLSRSSSMNSEKGSMEGRTAQERWRLLKNVTRISTFMKQAQRDHRHHKLSSKDSNSSSLRASVLSKRLSSNKLNRSQLRMDSSSQLNLCHDILLPSDEYPDSPFSAGASSSSQRRTQQSNKKRYTMVGNRKKCFSRASSWSTSASHSVLMKPQMTLQQQSSIHGKKSGMVSVGGSTTTLIRQMAVTGGPPADKPSHRSLSGGNSRRHPHIGEFKRMRSFHQVMAFKTRPGPLQGGSITNIPKHSNSEPEGFSLDLPQCPLSTQSSQVHSRPFSRSSSRQSSYLAQDSFSNSSAAIAAHSKVIRMTSNASAISQISGFSDDFHDDDGEDDGLILTREASSQEKREYGQIGFNVYLEYFKAGGIHFALAFLLFSVSLQCIKVYMDFLLRDWSLETDDSISMSYFSFYFYLSLCVLVLSVFANFMGQLLGARARRHLHSRMLTNLLRCPLELFEAYPIGRVINRFSYDMFVIDQKLPSSIQRLVLVSLICLSALTVNAIQSPIFVLFGLPMVGIYWWLQNFYRCTSRELQRLDSISRAPVLSHFSDTLGGLVTIRAFGEQQRFVNELCEKIDTNTVAFLILQSGCRWLGVALDFTGAGMVFASVIVNLIVCYQYPGDRSSASIGLIMNYSLLVPIYLAWVVKFLADIENYMNAVERVLEYTGLKSEEATTHDDPNNLDFTTDGSLCGEVKFDSVGLAHSLDLRAVIQSVSLDIPAKQKLAICGRSGSGKTTLLMGLARVAKILYGKITIDGVDITSLPLRTLRRHVWTVPQDVTLFSGTLRSNLDPEGLFDDESIWNCLDQIEGLKSMVSNLDNGLDTEVLENGDNFSHGQKQELSLARAILLKPPVVILDEATSALDPAREIHLHKCLLKAFADSTLISVAHRLSSIISYERVIVMGDGRILEDGKPRELLKKPMGFFSALWRAAGEKPFY